MKYRFLTIALMAALTAQIAAAQGRDATIAGATVPALVRDTLKAAGVALGMEFRGNADNIITAEFWGSGTMYSFGQAFLPGGEWPASKVTNYHVSLDYSAPMSMRLDYVRGNPDGQIRGGGGLPLAAPQRVIQVVSIDGNTRTKFAWNETEPGGGTITPALAAARDRQFQFWTMTPHAVIKAAVDSGDLTKVSKNAGGTVITFPLADASCRDTNVFKNTPDCQNARLLFTVTLDAKNLIQKVETRSNNPVLGDMVIETTYSDYKDLSEAKNGKVFPAHIVQKQGGFPVWDLNITKVDLDYPNIYIKVPDNVRAAAGQQLGFEPVKLTVKVDANKVADGVWYLTGDTHHSVAVEFKDHVALVECPQDEARALAVLAAVKQNIPNKPIRYIINSHHHFDHLGGLRACAAEGATILTQAANKPYYEKIWAQPHTIMPDRLVKEKKKALIEAVADKRVLTDGSRSLELYKLAGTSHVDTMLIAYLPKEKVLIEADVYTPGPANAPAPARPSPEAVNLYEQVQRLKLDVQQITPLHGRLVSIDDLRKAIGRSSD